MVLFEVAPSRPVASAAGTNGRKTSGTRPRDRQRMPMPHRPNIAHNQRPTGLAAEPILGRLLREQR